MTWGGDSVPPFSSSKELFILQKRAIRIITNSNVREHCKPLFRQPGIMTLYGLYIFKCLINVKVNLDSHKTGADVHHHNTRLKNNLLRPNCRLATTKNSFDHVKLCLFNHLPHEVRICILRKFKGVLHSWIVTQAFYSLNEFLESNTQNCIF